MAGQRDSGGATGNRAERESVPPNCAKPALGDGVMQIIASAGGARWLALAEFPCKCPVVFTNH